MHTEEDTFNKLRKLSYREAFDTWGKAMIEYGRIGDKCLLDYDTFLNIGLKRTGWTINEIREYATNGGNFRD